MHQVITIGSALVDIFVYTSKFQLMPTEQGTLLCQLHGSKTEVNDFNVYTGGGGSNTAVGFARMGFKTGVVCETGRDSFSFLVTEDLRRNGVSESLVICEKSEQTGGSVILVCKNGERSVLVHRGAAAKLDSFDVSAYHLSQAEWVHLSSIGGRLKTLEKIFLAIDRSDSTKLSWNQGKKELSLLADRRILIRDIPCEVFIVNYEEWEMVLDLQAQILAYFPYVVITNGKRGGEIYHQQHHLTHYSAKGDKVVDSTGAGDAFSVGFVTGLLWNLSPKKAAILGSENAANVIRYYGAKAGLLTKNQIADKMKSVGLVVPCLEKD